MRESALVLLLVAGLGCASVPSAGTVPFEIGLVSFAPGDSVEITEVLGPAPSFRMGETYTIRGRYTLTSRDAAEMDAWCMNGESEGDRSRTIHRGSGAFEMTFRRVAPGYPHISLYPVEGGESFGSVFFGSGDCVWRTPFSITAAGSAAAPGG